MDLELNGKKEFYPKLNNKIYKVLKVDTKNKEDYMCKQFIEFIKSSKVSLHFIGIDFEFKKVSKESKEVALMQINLENDSNVGQIFILYPTGLNEKNSKILLDLITNRNITKILHGAESLDIPYLFNELLVTKENIDGFCENFYDTKFLCDYMNLDKGFYQKCSIYNLLLTNNIITEKQLKNLDKIEERMGPIYLVEIDINNMSLDLLKYALYDVIFLVELIKKFLNLDIVYIKIIPEISCVVNKYKRNVETEFNELEKLVNSLNIAYLIDNNNRVLLKDIWEMYYWIFTDTKKYLEKIREIHYFKNFFEIITKLFVYYNVIKQFRVYISKDRVVTRNHFNFEKYFMWLRKYPYINNIFVEFNNFIKNDL